MRQLPTTGLALFLFACGGVAARASDDAGPPTVEIEDAGDENDKPRDADEPLDAGPTVDASEASAPPFCGPTPFSQLRCFGHPDAGMGTSHAAACDAGSTADCTLTNDGATWCCPQ